MAIININHKQKNLSFSGANNPLYLISKNKEKENHDENVNKRLYSKNKDFSLTELKGDRMPVAIHEDMRSFQSHKLSYNNGDRIYLFSDGFADQFGGKTEAVRKTGGKKFKYKKFKELLLNSSDTPMNDQKEILNNEFTNWKGSLEQLDDVCVIGIEL